jgi:tetratricopeptide (TPR) repeat protein
VPIHLRGTHVEIEGDFIQIDLRRLLDGTAQREELIEIGTRPFLPFFEPRLGDQFARWLDKLREKANAMRRTALIEAIREARSAGRFRDISRLAPSLLTIDPLNETATLCLAEAMVMEGSKVQALKLLDEYEEEVGPISDALRIPVRILRRRVSEGLDDALLPAKGEVAFVGRDTVNSVLRTSYAKARGGQGHRLVVVGEAGIGKSRLANELMRLAVLDGSMVVSYSCTSGDALSPISSIISLVQKLITQPGALGCSQEHLQYLRRLSSTENEPPPAIVGLGADVLYAQLTYAISELIAAVTDEGPLVVFVDDAQRLHPTAWQMVSDLAGRLRDHRLLLILAARHIPDTNGSLSATLSDRQSLLVRLGPLTYEASREYLDSWSDKCGINLSDRSKDGLARGAAGNPFFLGEFANHVARGGDAQEAPASIKALIEAQYASASKESQRVMLVIGLLQSRATLGRVTAVLGVTPSAFISALEELERLGLITTQGAFLRAKHDIVADLTLALGAPSVVTFLKARIAEILEAEADDTDSVELLNESLAQWESAGDAKQTFRVGFKLGQRLLHLGLASDAIDAFRRSELVATSVEDRTEVLEQLMRASFLAGNAPMALQQFDRWRAFRDDSGSNGVVAPEFLLLAAEGGLTALHRPVNYHELLTLAEDRTLTGTDRMRALSICAMSADLFYDAEALQQVRSLLGESQDRGGGDVYEALSELICKTILGSRGEAMDALTRVLSLSKRHDDLRVRLMAPRWASSALRRFGDHSARTALVQESLREALRYRLKHHEISCWEHLADSYLRQGEISEAKSFLDRLEGACEPGSPLHGAYCLPLKASLAYETRDKSISRMLLPLFSGPAPFAAVVSQHAWLAFRVAMKIVVDPRAIGPEELSGLHQYQLRGQPFGGQDERVRILADALLTVGHARAARDVIESYSVSAHAVPRTRARLASLLQSHGEAA